MRNVMALLLSVALFVLMAGCTQSANRFGEQQDEWGIELQALDVSSTGMTLACVQSGGSAAGDLQTGSSFVIEQFVDGEWMPVNTVQGILDWAWTLEAWMIRRDSTTQWEVNWDFLYGELDPGTYRISKVIMDFRGPGDYTEKTYYAEFAIVD